MIKNLMVALAVAAAACHSSSSSPPGPPTIDLPGAANAGKGAPDRLHVIPLAI